MSKKVMKIITSYVIIILIASAVALSYNIFVFPNKFAPAGVNGIGTMIQYLLGIKLSNLNLIINLPLFVCVFFIVGKRPAVRSLTYVLTFSLMLNVFEKVDLSAFAYTSANGSFSGLLGPLVAGMITGAGAGILHKMNANCGGTEYVASIIHHYRSDFNLFWIIFALNIGVAICSYFVYDYKIEPVLLCIVYCYCSSGVRDKITNQSRSATRFEIITKHPDEIASEITGPMHHTATRSEATGVFTGEGYTRLVTVINNSQVAELSAYLSDYDNTFVVLSPVSQVLGNFKKYDAKGKRKTAIYDSGRRK